MSFGSPNNPYEKPQNPQQPQQPPPQQPGYGYPQQQPPQQQPGYGYPQQAPQGVPPQQGYPQQAPQGVPPQQGYPQQPGYGYPQAPQVPASAYGYPQGGYPGAPLPNVASMGRRLGARLIDGVLFFVVYLILGAVGAVGSMNSIQDCDPNAADYESCLNDASSSVMGTAFALIGVLIAFGLLYEWLMIGLMGATLGKKALGIRVVKADTGENPGLGSSFIRWIIAQVGSFVCGIGALLVYLSPFFDKSGRQQGWHDKAANTMVLGK
jgi:uncharacterized RDD family membrane protein YckC